MKTIEVNTLTKMFLAGAKNLEAKKEWINELNVFPVPDGDTGTNMTLTIMSAASEVNNLSERTMETVAKAISSGSLRGARGNSGVILSQLLRGFTKGIKGYETLDVMIISNAFQKAVETAYKAVMKPKEGTILTVARGAADKAAELALEEEDLDVFFSGIIEEAERVLATTPDLLPVLKEAGVAVLALLGYILHKYVLLVIFLYGDFAYFNALMFSSVRSTMGISSWPASPIQKSSQSFRTASSISFSSSSPARF